MDAHLPSRRSWRYRLRNATTGSPKLPVQKDNDSERNEPTRRSTTPVQGHCLKIYRLTICYIQNSFQDLKSPYARAIIRLFGNLYAHEGGAEKKRQKFQLRKWKSWDMIESLINHDVIRAAISDVQGFLTTFSSRLPTGIKMWLDCFETLLKIDLDNMSMMISQIIMSPERERFIELPAELLRAVMNVLQMLIDGRYANYDILQKFLKELVKKREILPSHIFISGVSRVGTNPIKGGGFADVWKGNSKCGTVALKVLRIFDQDGLDMKRMHREFCIEAMIWRTIKHENILPFLGVCEDIFGPQLAMVSPWLENGDLATFLKGNETINRVKMIEGVAHGLRYLHTLKPAVVHGDLRAGNVLVDENHNPRIADFGLTEVIESRVSTVRTTSVKSKGSLRWQAPELLDANRFEGVDGSVTSKSDVYAFACLCLEVFTGEVPFSGMRDGAVILAVAVQDRRPSRPSNPATQRGLDNRIWNIIESCWGVQPANRPDMSTVVDWLSPPLPGT